MLKKIFFIGFFLSTITLYCQSPNPEIIKLRERIESLEKLLNEENIKRLELLDEKYNLISDKIQYYNNVFNIFLVIFGSVIVVFGIGLPVGGYFFSRSEYRKLNKNLKNKFNKYMKTHFSKQITDTIDNLIIDERTYNNFHYQFLASHKHYDFSKNHYRKIFEILIEEPMISAGFHNIRVLFMSILSKQHSMEADIFFIKNIKDNTTHEFLINYLDNSRNDDNYTKKVSDEILKNDDTIISFFKSLKQHSILHNFIFFCNYNYLVNKLKSKIVIRIYEDSVKRNEQIFNDAGIDINNLKISKKYKEYVSIRKKAETKKKNISKD